MSRKFKIAIASLMLLGTASAAPAYARPPHAPLHSAPVNSWQERQDAPVAGPGYYEGDYEFNVDRFDHASSPYAGGGGK